MDSHLNGHCVICGLYLHHDLDESDPQAYRRPWYAEVRGLYASHVPPSYVSITGIGIIRDQQILAPTDQNLSYTDTADLGQWTLHHVPRQRWAFGLHNSCWKLLCLRLQASTPAVDVAQATFHHFQSISYVGRPRFLIAHSMPLLTQRTDPCVIPTPEQLESFSEDNLTEPDWKLVIQPGLPQNRLFRRLNLELRWEILSYIPCGQLLQLRFVNRELARLAKFSSVPAKYWRSRFCLHQEADNLFLNLNAKRDWRRLFLGYRRCIKGWEIMAMGCRVTTRNLLEPIATLMELQRPVPTHPGDHPVGPLDPQKGHFRIVGSRAVVEVVDFVSGRLSELRSPLRQGCRALSFRMHDLARTYHGGARLGVSFVEIGSKTFVSGMRLVQPEKYPFGNFQLGFHNPVTERWIMIQRFAYLQGFCFAYSDEGLRGLQVLPAGRPATYWVGDAEGPGISHRRIGISSAPSWYALNVGLDQYKIVWIGLCKLKSGQSTSSENAPTA
ncbi:hypothetical protein BDW59DRAFT_156665 [Aspergillus cavernicola]|uniref:DUF7600 domain-containing protein n=1 Tax=Aspergillus cavernicola TaxID=176166 RepID=A0ABR4J2T9_9EURO